MRMLAALLTLSAIVPHGVSSQNNIVPNGSFEEFSQCPPVGSFSFLEVAIPWIYTGHGDDSPDYFNACNLGTASGNPYLGVPENNRGYQYARSGVAYGGFFAYEWNNPNGREFVQVELSEPIVAGVRYEVVFHVSLADNYFSSVSTMGALFSDTMIVRNTYQITDLGLESQVNSAEGMVFDDKENWTEVRDTFRSRYGGERFIVIGNFKLDAESGVTNHFGDDETWINRSRNAYYYIDDVSVVALDSMPNSVAEIGRPELFKVYPNPNNGEMTLRYLLGEGETGQVSVFSLMGHKVVEHSLTRNSDMMEISMGGASPGIYLIRVQVNGKPVLTERMVILRP